MLEDEYAQVTAAMRSIPGPQKPDLIQLLSPWNKAENCCSGDFVFLASDFARFQTKVNSECVQIDFESNLNLRKATLQDIQELKTKLKLAIKRQNTARNVTLRDKISFVIGTTLAM